MGPPLQLQPPPQGGIVLGVTSAAHLAPGGSLDGQGLGGPGYAFAEGVQGPACAVPPAFDRTTAPPLARWDIEAEMLPRRGADGAAMPMRFGAFVSGAELFDAAAFGISRAEAALQDPQQRLLLEAYATAAQGDADALSASFAPAPTHPSSSSSSSTTAAPSLRPTAAATAVASSAVGVYVGVSQLEYARITLDQDVPMAAYYATGAHLSVTSGRISYTFGLRGAAVTVDTACSSSLTACHLAAASLLHADVGGGCGGGGVGAAAAAAAAVLGVNLTLASSWTQVMGLNGAVHQSAVAVRVLCKMPQEFLRRK